MDFNERIEQVFHKLKYELGGDKSFIDDFEKAYQSNKSNPPSQPIPIDRITTKLPGNFALEPITIKLYAAKDGMNPVEAVSIVEELKNAPWFRDDNKFREQIIKNYKSIVEGDPLRYRLNTEQKYHEFYQYVVIMRSEIISRIVHEIKLISPTIPKVKEAIEKDFTLSTIHDYLEGFQPNLLMGNYDMLVSALMDYFENGSFPELEDPIQLNGKVSQKKFGWALSRILKSKNKGVTKEVVQFAKQYISLYRDVKYDEVNYRKCNLYKYLTQKPTKNW